jgi:hypothetical protein
MTNPYPTIGEALDMASDGDTIRVAQGVYTENLDIHQRVTLEGGYESAGWTRDISQYRTTIDGSNNQTVVGDWDGGSLGFPQVISDSGQYQMWYDGFDSANLGLGWRLGLAASPDGLGWTKAISNPVLALGAAGEWDSSYRGQVSIIVENDLYKMWYSGSDDGLWQTGYATSTNGIDWIVYADNPVLPVGDEGWDEQEADGPTVIKDDGLYKMWYHGCDHDYTVGSIGYATSTNGLDWTKYVGNPVLTGTVGAWDENSIWWPRVIKNGSTYEMWYYSDEKVGRATSPDGIRWTKYEDNPVLSEGWDSWGVFPLTVLLEGATYKMWFGSGPRSARSVGYAESSDGIFWTQPVTQPVLLQGTPTLWGDHVVRLGNGSDGAVLDGFTVTGGDAYQGSGIVVYSANVTIQNCTVDDNRAWDAGAGIGMSDSARVTIHNTAVSNNVRWGGGGGGAGLWADGSTLTVTDSVFQHNEAIYHAGGGIGLWNGAVMSATHITVADNTNTGIDLRGASIHLADSTIFSNTADEGGGLAVDGGSSATIEGCVFISNTASQSGGGLFAFDQATVVIEDSVFRGNVAQKWHGGAIEGMGQRLEVRRSKFLNNQAPFGGGLDVAHWVRLEDVEIVGNVATNVGGGVRVPLGGGNIVIINTRIVTNTAFGNGGGLLLWAGSTKLYETLVQGNVAGDGGGVWASRYEGPEYGDTESPELALVNTQVVSNTSSNQAGGLWLEKMPADLVNVTIAGNRATNGYGGVWASPLSTQTVAFTNTIRDGSEIG